MQNHKKVGNMRKKAVRLYFESVMESGKATPPFYLCGLSFKLDREIAELVYLKAVCLVLLVIKGVQLVNSDLVETVKIRPPFPAAAKIIIQECICALLAQLRGHIECAQCQNIDTIVAKTPTLQYRFKKGGKQGEPIVVPEEDMKRFIGAVKASDNPKFYSVEEISSLMCGRNIRMVGGVLNGYEGKLQTVRGSKNKRLIIG
jgi:hypothetical protein